jgi:hypothetical protein
MLFWSRYNPPAQESREPARKRKNTASLELISTKIKALEKRTIANIAEIGGLLHEASEQCEYGEYGDWLVEGQFRMVAPNFVALAGRL